MYLVLWNKYDNYHRNAWLYCIAIISFATKDTAQLIIHVCNQYSQNSQN